MKYESGTCMFAGVDDPEMVADAKAYCKRMELTMDDAVLTRNDGRVCVILKRAVEFDGMGRKIDVDETREAC